LAEQPLEEARDQLLNIRGVGPETADSILLYALGRPTFVVDTYTYRILSRHQLVPEESDYEGLRSFFMEALPEEVPLFNEFHALLVRTGNTYCKKKAPLCGDCPLRDLESETF
jgi:endonuclease-3 related protein